MALLLTLVCVCCVMSSGLGARNIGFRYLILALLCDSSQAGESLPYLEFLFGEKVSRFDQVGFNHIALRMARTQ